MSISLDIMFLDVPSTILFAALLSVSTIVGGCGWSVSARLVQMDVSSWQVSKDPPNSDSVDYFMTFLVIINSTCMVHFLGALPLLVCCFCISFQVKNTPLLC